MSRLIVPVQPPQVSEVYDRSTMTPTFKQYLVDNYTLPGERAVTKTVRLTEPLAIALKLAKAEGRDRENVVLYDRTVASAAVAYPIQCLIGPDDPLYFDSSERVVDRMTEVYEGTTHPDMALRWTGPYENRITDKKVGVKIRPSRWNEVDRLADSLGCEPAIFLRHLMAYSFYLYSREHRDQDNRVHQLLFDAVGRLYAAAERARS